MTIEDLRDKLVLITQGYFSDANVSWDRTNKVMPTLKLVCLDLGIEKRAYQAVAQESGENEKTYTLVAIPWTVELFTHGKKATHTKDGKTYEYRKNTALDEINAFVDYMDSDVVQDTLNSYNIVVILDTIQDTSMVHDNDYEYRAKVEFEVRFENVATKSMASIGIIEHAEIEEEEDE